jgi:tetratricopeptide (TPR) repeat protein
LNVLPAPFLYDDHKDIARNPILLNPDRLAEVFSRSFLHEGRQRGLYRPVAGLTYWIDHRLFGPKPLGFHLENVIWHGAASLMVLALLRQLWPKEPYLALAGAALFAVHPVHTEAVSWVSGRPEVLAAFFGLLTFWAHRRADEASSGRLPLRALALGGWLLALGAKESAATVPLLLVMTDALLGKPERWWKPRILLERYGPYVPLALAYLTVRWMVLGRLGPVGVHQYFQGEPIWVRASTMLKVASAYAGRLLWPVNLNLAWIVPHARGLLDGPAPALSMMLLVTLLGLAWYLRRRAAPVSWGVFWWALALLPVSNLWPIGELAAERFLYLPSVGACAALGWAFSRGEEQAGEDRSVWRRLCSAPVFLGLAVVVLFSVNTVDRNRDWMDAYRLWRKTVRQSPESLHARMNLGKVLFQMGRVKEAAGQFEAVLERSPHYVDALNNLAAAYAKLGRLDDARRAFARATAIRPDHPQAWFNLGFLLIKKGDLAEAREALERARALDPANPKIPYLLGLIAYRHGDLDGARILWQETLSLDPAFGKAQRALLALERARRRPR